MKKWILVLMVFWITSDSHSQTNLNSGLLACYPFTGNANDLSGNGHHGTVLGPVLTTDRFGISNVAYMYDGVNDYINIGSLSTFTQSPSFSISVWIKPNQVKLQTILMAIPDDFNDRFNAMAYYNHNGVSSTIWDFGDCSGGGRLMFMGTAFSNVWQHYIYTINPATGMNVYKDGVLNLTQATSSSCINRQRNLWIGGGFDAANAPFYFDGVIDDIRLYDRELTPAEVSALFQLEQFCSITSISEISSSDFKIIKLNENLHVKVRDGIPVANFKMVNCQGKMLYEKQNVKGGEQFEVSLAEFANGVLIYSFESGDDIVAGKIIN